MSAPIEAGIRYEAEVLDHTLEGAGVCRVDGYAVFVEGALKGERIAFTPLRVTKKFATARLDAVLRPSPHRVQPFCPHFGQCGGCAAQRMDESLRRQLLDDGLRAALRRVPGIERADFPPPLYMENPFAYRCKAVFTAVTEDGRPRLGFLEEKSHRVTPLERCPLLHPRLMEAARAASRAAGEPGSPLMRAGLRQVMVRLGLRTGQLMMVLETRDPLDGALPSLRTLPGLRSLYGRSGGEPRLLWGQPAVTERIMGKEFIISADSFFQVNPVQTDVLYGLVRRHVEATAPALLLDAYCGTGSMGLTVTDLAGQVLGVEYTPAAVEDARRNARANGIENARFRQGLAETVIPSLLSEGVRPDMILVDPPRRGLDAALTEAVVRAAVPRVVYVSCNPFTLARDLTAFAGGGYRIEAVQGVDLFPWTGHVECVIGMQRKSTLKSLVSGISQNL